MHPGEDGRTTNARIEEADRTSVRHALDGSRLRGVLIDVAANPSSAVETAPITVVVDTLRAATTITTMHERGIEHIWIAETLAAARRLKTSNAEALLCGEERGLRPPDFVYGNSPSEFASLELEGESAILATSNGTPLLRRHASADVLLIGCLRNARATADAAAGPDRPVLIACAGLEGQGEPMIEDTFTAGAIVNHLIRIHDGFELGDGAQEAFETFLAHDGDPSSAFATSPHANHLASVGFEADLEFCAALDVSMAVAIAEKVGAELRTTLLRS